METPYYRFVAHILPDLKAERSRFASVTEKEHKDYKLVLCEVTDLATVSGLKKTDTFSCIYAGSFDEFKEYGRRLIQALSNPILHVEDLAPDRL